MTSPFESFRKLAEPNLVRGCDALLSTLAFRQEHVGAPEEWVSLSTRILLIPPGLPIPGPTGEKVFESGRFRAARGIVTGARVVALLEGFERGRLVREGLPEGSMDPLAVAAQVEHRSLTEPRFFEPFSRPIHLPWELSGYEVSDQSHVTVGDAGFWSAFERMQRELTAWDPPYLGMAGLARDLLLPSVPARDIVRVAEVVFPFWLQLLSVTPAQDRRTMQITVRSHWSSVPEEATVSVIPHRSGAAGRRMPLTDPDWTTRVENEALVLRRDLPIGEGPTSVCLNFGAESIASVVTGLGSSRVVSHLIADPGAAWLRSCLTRKESQSSEVFETGVAWLFHLLGFASVRYGYKRLQRAVDVQAFLDDGRVIFAECSVELPDSTKLHDVKHRAKLLETAAERSGRAVHVVPTVFTSASSSNSERASDPDVLVFAREEIDSLLERALRGDSPYDVFQEMEYQLHQQIAIATMTS